MNLRKTQNERFVYTKRLFLLGQRSVVVVGWQSLIVTLTGGGVHCWGLPFWLKLQLEPGPSNGPFDPTFHPDATRPPSALRSSAPPTAAGATKPPTSRRGTNLPPTTMAGATKPPTPRGANYLPAYHGDRRH